MYKLYVGAINGDNIYKESANKEELVLLYESFSRDHQVATATLVDDKGNNLRESLQGHSYRTILSE